MNVTVGGGVGDALKKCGRFLALSGLGPRSGSRMTFLRRRVESRLEARESVSEAASASLLDSTGVTRMVVMA